MAENVFAYIYLLLIIMIVAGGGFVGLWIILTYAIDFVRHLLRMMR